MYSSFRESYETHVTLPTACSFKLPVNCAANQRAGLNIDNSCGRWSLKGCEDRVGNETKNKFVVRTSVEGLWTVVFCGSAGVGKTRGKARENLRSKAMGGHMM